MSVFDIILKPIELLLEIVFSLVYKAVPNPAVCIIFLSLIVNFLVLPLYNRADEIQKKSGAKEKALRPLADHIKRSFKGDEKIMMLNTLYRQYQYSPVQSLSSIISLILQIPFFIVAYNFLSGLSVLDTGFGPIANLLKPDGLISADGMKINVLPVLMTVINIISLVIYLKKDSVKKLLTMLIVPIVFLVLLYDSPSGIVLYWTMNNVFSLVKNIVVYTMGDKVPKVTPVSGGKGEGAVVLPMIYCTLLAGALIPSAVISASPIEFVNRLILDNPVSYILYSLFIFAGIFILWPLVFYMLMSPNGKKISYAVMCSLAVILSVDYFVFGTKNERLTSVLEIDGGYHADVVKSIVNAVVISALALIAYQLAKKLPKVFTVVLISGIFVVGLMSVLNVVRIQKTMSEYKSSGNGSLMIQADSGLGEKDGSYSVELSKNGKNVLMIMLDRAIGSMVPYIFEERPDLYEQFDGFTYYANTMSFGDCTAYGAPALYGGYEYTPAMLNLRTEELLKEKHNESLLVVPTMFLKNGYKVTYIDPPYVNYSAVTDLSIFDGTGINALSLSGKMNDQYQNEAKYLKTKRNRSFIVYSVFKMAPLFVQEYIYDEGNYNSMGVKYDSSSGLDDLLGAQIPEGIDKATGVSQLFMNEYTTLASLPGLTKITDDDDNTFISMCNAITHEAILLQEPDYLPTPRTDNSEYERMNASRFVLNGRIMHNDEYLQMAHYHVNMAAYIKLGEWFDYLKEQGVWDNTRIIVTSDHGHELAQFDDLTVDKFGFDAEGYNPVLMFKDFGSKGKMITVNEFMTNADVPNMILDGLISDKTNPFTGTKIGEYQKGEQGFTVAIEYSRGIPDGATVFPPARWYSIRDNIYDEDLWQSEGEH